MYVKVTLRRVRETIVAVENQQILHILSVCVCSLRYPTRTAQAPLGLSGCTIFFHIIS